MTKTPFSGKNNSIPGNSATRISMEAVNIMVRASKRGHLHLFWYFSAHYRAYIDVAQGLYYGDHAITENFHFPKYRHTAANIRLTKYWMEHTIRSGTLRFSTEKILSCVYKTSKTSFNQDQPRKNRNKFNGSFIAV